ncbi:MAG: hypothetical protein JWO15_3736 [Sphingomonadales bacterium]|nr:hypothetical protein [Sphingomonadales bacterium]
MSTAVLSVTLPELIVPSRRLGRHVEHDPASKAFAVAEASAPKPVQWERRCPVLDQGDLGSCTGNSAAGWLGTDTATRPGLATVDEDQAVAFYSVATHHDRARGVYPPDDTGSSGLAAAKALKLAGHCHTYRHAFSVKAALTALQAGPVMVGMAWLTGCDEPDRLGHITYRGQVRGGHEILFDGYDGKGVWATNSWGEGWGRAGRFWLSLDDFAKALANQGDVVSPTA